MQEIEARQGRGYELWQVTRQWSIDYFQDIYNDLNLKFRDTFYESEFIDAGRKIVDELLAKGILKRSEGAIIADLEEYGLGVLPIIRSDGTALYPVSDLALASAKFDKYQLQESIYVVDIRQGLYFKQLFKILELMGYHQKMTHLPYEFLTTKNGMMASRTGNVITYKELKDEFLARTTEEIKERHADWTDDRISKTAFGLSISAMKFEMVKVSAEKVITFDMAEALRFEGFTAAYLQYTGARICSLFKKAGVTDPIIADSVLLQADQEFALALRLAKYGEAVKKAGVDRDPSVVARYLFELAQDFNDYYHAVNIMNAEQKVKDARLSLVAAVRQILHNGFSILGLVYLEEM
jgi:arginyl-tRNA synthetase